MKLLLDNLSPLNAQDRSGLTPLHHAVAEGHGDVAVELLKRGAESGLLDKEGNLALKLAPDQKVSGLFVVFPPSSFSFSSILRRGLVGRPGEVREANVDT